MRLLGLIFVFTTLLLPIAAEYQFEGLVLTTITSGTVTQTLILQTQTITSCCNGTETTSTGPAIMSMPNFVESSGGRTVRPGVLWGVVGCMAVLGGMVVMS